MGNPLFDILLEMQWKRRDRQARRFARRCSSQRARLAALEARLAEVERERDAARARIRELEEALRALRDADRDRALVIVSKQKTTAADTRYWRARCAAYALIGPTSATDGDSDAQGDR